MKKHKRMDKWKVAMPGKDAFNHKMVSVEGWRYLDFGIRKSEKGRGYIVDHVPTGMRAGGERLFASAQVCREFIKQLYHLGTWDSPQRGDYKAVAAKAMDLASRFAG